MGTRVLGSGTLPAGASVSRTINIRVPSGTPTGSYNFTLRLVDPDTGTDCDSYAETVSISAPHLSGDGGADFSVEGDADLTPAASALGMVAGAALSPNPFRGRTTLTLTLAAPAHVRAEVFDVLGRRIATLADEVMATGTQILTWEAEGVAPGLYVVRVRTGDGHIEARRVTLVE